MMDLLEGPEVTDRELPHLDSNLISMVHNEFCELARCVDGIKGAEQSTQWFWGLLLEGKAERWDARETRKYLGLLADYAFTAAEHAHFLRRALKGLDDD